MFTTLFILIKLVHDVRSQCDSILAATCQSGKPHFHLTCIDDTIMELETVTVSGETYDRCRCKERFTFYD